MVILHATKGISIRKPHDRRCNHFRLVQNGSRLNEVCRLQWHSLLCYSLRIFSQFFATFSYVCLFNCHRRGAAFAHPVVILRDDRLLRWNFCVHWILQRWRRLFFFRRVLAFYYCDCAINAAIINKIVARVNLKWCQCIGILHNFLFSVYICFSVVVHA